MGYPNFYIYIPSISLVVLFCLQKLSRQGGWCRRSGAGPAAPVPPGPTMASVGIVSSSTFFHAQTSRLAYGRLANMCQCPDSFECGVGGNKHATMHTTAHTNQCVWVMKSETAEIKTSQTPSRMLLTRFLELRLLYSILYSSATKIVLVSSISKQFKICGFLACSGDSCHCV